MAKKRIIPFWLLPASWGLTGKSREIARIEYELDGDERERALASLEYSDDKKELNLALLKIDRKYNLLTQEEYEYNVVKTTLRHDREKELSDLDHQLKSNFITHKEHEEKYNEIINEYDKKQKLDFLDLDLKYGKITKEDYEYKKIEITHSPGPEMKLAMLDLDFELKKISKNEYEKEKATLEGRPWVGVVNYNFTPEEGVNGFSFELDWNDFFIDFLKEHGYSGDRDDYIVEQWFDDVSQDQLSQLLDIEFGMDDQDYSTPRTMTNKEVKGNRTHYS